MGRTLILGVLLCCFGFQGLNAQFVNKADGIGFSLGTSITVCKDSSIVSVGIYQAELKFKTDVYNTTGKWDAFIVKYDKSGEYLWSKNVVNSSPDNSNLFITINEVETDSLDNIFVTGFYNNGAVFDGMTLSSGSDSSNFFLAKYSPDGDFLWVSESKLIADSSSVLASSLAIDNDGNSFCIGTFSDSIVFGLDTLYSSNTDFFLVKYDSTGKYVRSIQSDSSIATGIGVDSDQQNNVYITGNFKDTLNINGVSTVKRDSLSTDVFIKKLDSSFVEVWSKTERLANVYSLEVDAKSNVYLSASYADTVILDFPNDTLFSSAKKDLLIKYNSAGDYEWSKVINANSQTGLNRTNSVDTDQDGNVYVIGTLGSSSGVNTVSVDGITESGVNGEDVYVLKMDSSGVVDWIQTAGGNSFDIGTDVAVIDSAHVYVTGYFVNEVIFGSSSAQNTVGFKAFFAEVDPCPELDISIVDPLFTEVCEDEEITLATSTTTGINFKWLYNGALIIDSIGPSLVLNSDSSGSYQVITNDGGICEKSSNVVDITFNPLPMDSSIVLGDTTVLCVGEKSTLSVDFNSKYSYRWYLNDVLSPGDVTSIYKDSISGEKYAEIINEFGCLIRSKKATTTFLEDPSPEFTASGDLLFCEGDSVVFTYPNLPGYTYQWTKERQPLVGEDNHLLTVKESGEYGLIVKNVAECTTVSNDTAVVTISSPVGAIEALTDTTVCEGNEVVLITDQLLGLTYQWLKDDVEIPLAVNNTFAIDETGNYAVIVTSGNNCNTKSRSIEAKIISNPLAEITVTNSKTDLCEGEEVVFEATNLPDVSYEWIKDSETISNAMESSFSTNTAGFYSVKIIDAFGCNSESEKELVTVSPIPNASITIVGDTIFCKGDSVSFIANTGTDQSYQWYFNGTEIVGASDINFIAKESGLFSVETTNIKGCKNVSVPIEVGVFLAPNANIVVTGNTAFCEGDSVLFSLTKNSVYSYEWFKDGFPLLGESGSEFYAKTAGMYTGKISVGENCSDLSGIEEVKTNQNDEPIVVKNGVTVSTAGYETYQWLLDGEVIEGATLQNINAKENGGYSVNVVGFNGCENTSKVVFVCVPAPEASVVENRLETSGGDAYQWYFNDIVIPNSTNDFHFAQASGVYKVLVTDATSCSSFTNEIKVCLPLPTVTDLGFGGRLQASEGDSFQWFFNDKVIENATTKEYVAIEEGEYSVEITLDNCTSRSENVYIIEVGLESDVTSYFNMYPNPAKEFVNIEFSKDQFFTYQVLNSLGAILYDGNSKSLSLENYSSGIYTIRFFNVDEEIVNTLKLFKE